MPYDETFPVRAPRICGAVVVPPPLNGMALVSQQMLRGFGASGGVTRPEGLPRALWPVWRHLSLSRQLMQADGEVLYFVPDAGCGLRLNALEARLMQRFDHVILHHHVFSYILTYAPRFARFRAQLKKRVSHIMLSHSMGLHMRKTYELADDIHVLGNSGIAREVTRTSPRKYSQSIGYLSNITRDKGIDTFLETARAVSARHPHIQIQIAGPIADATLRRLVEAFVAEAPSTRRWLGPITGVAKTKFLTEIDVLLFPTRYKNEAQPLVIFEALASGTPVLATPLGCIPEQLEDTDWLLSEDGFAEAATSVITHWIAHPERFKEASRTASAIYASHQARDQAAMHALQAQFGRA